MKFFLFAGFESKINFEHWCREIFSNKNYETLNLLGPKQRTRGTLFSLIFHFLDLKKNSMLQKVSVYKAYFALYIELDQYSFLLFFLLIDFKTIYETKFPVKTIGLGVQTVKYMHCY